MVCISGPSIIDNGLVLNLDAANPRSYPGSGTTWYDLSGNSNHATLINSPTFSNSFFSFDGTNQSAKTIISIDFTSYSAVTLEVIFKPTQGTSSMLIEHTANWNTQTGGFGLSINSNGGGFSSNLCHSNHRPAGGTWGRNNPSITNDGVWITQSSVFSSVVDSNGRYVIENGQIKTFTSSPYSASTATSTATTFANSTLYIGSRGSTGSFYSGDIRSVKVYGKKLDLNEHKQNFEAIRSRYNV